MVMILYKEMIPMYDWYRATPAPRTMRCSINPARYTLTPPRLKNH